MLPWILFILLSCDHSLQTNDTLSKFWKPWRWKICTGSTICCFLHDELQACLKSDVNFCHRRSHARCCICIIFNGALSKIDEQLKRGDNVLAFFLETSLARGMSAICWAKRIRRRGVDFYCSVRVLDYFSYSVCLSNRLCSCEPLLGWSVQCAAYNWRKHSALYATSWVKRIITTHFWYYQTMRLRQNDVTKGTFCFLGHVIKSMHIYLKIS